VLLNNNDEFEVVSYDVLTEKTGYPFKYYALDVLNEGERYTLKLLHEDSFLSFNNALESLKKEAIKTKDNYARRLKWVNYFKLSEKYIDAKYNYALTVHKSQGSTFDNSIVIYCDILRIKNIEERNKLLYTSITRAKNNLYLIY
jgi:exodeoxyribonuclease-5